MNHDEEAQRLIADDMAERDARSVKAIYDIATVGSRTRLGGEVVTGCAGVEIDDLRVACVGDTVRYPDGSESKIVSGAGYAYMVGLDHAPVAIVGSATDNGDTITESTQHACQIALYEDDEIPGFLEAGWKYSEYSETGEQK